MASGSFDRPLPQPPPSGSKAKSLLFASVPVVFPYTPYRAQNALMHSVITAMRDSQHALIESPTGTGKSLALLCSALAYQQFLQEGGGRSASGKDDARREGMEDEQEAEPASNMENKGTPGVDTVRLNSAGSKPVDSGDGRSNTKDREADPDVGVSARAKNASEDDDLSSDSDFQTPKKFRDVSWQKPLRRLPKPCLEEQPANAFMLERSVGVERDKPLDVDIHMRMSGNEQGGGRNPVGKGKAVPRIFYGTRTHNQVAQVISELRKTTYRPNICVLASRKEYCIREEVRSESQRDQICKAMVKSGDCELYFHAAELASNPDLREEAWDIEELNQLGKTHAGCPYYASHELYQEAQLIFCPYSFLVDPIVRKARGINLSGDVVILDEAHNIENYARESAGFQGDIADIRRLTEEINSMTLTGSLCGERESLAPAYQSIKDLLESFLTLADNVVAEGHFEQHGLSENALFEEQRLIEQLAAVNVNEEQVVSWRAAHEYIVNFGDGNDAKRAKKMGGAGLLLEDSAVAATCDKPSALASARERPQSGSTDNSITKPVSRNYGYGCDPEKGPDELNMEIMEDNGSVKSFRARRHRRYGKQLRGRGKRRGVKQSPQEQAPWIAKSIATSHALLTTLEFMFASPEDFCLVIDRRTIDFMTTISINIVCLNAAVCFRDVSAKARSVIVTSGTLAPINSFAGELGTKFAISKSLPHVIDVEKQLFVSVVGEGPGRVLFDATFNGSGKFSFQDSLGDAIVDYCDVVPGGVLVFFPSYRLMNQLHTRWKSSGVWEKLQRRKGVVLVEPNQRGEEFDSMLSQYSVASTSPNGAVLFGVCRGKLSEGVDFKDGSSRAVVLIGIPFPNKGDVVIARKRMWNDRSRSTKSREDLQTGGQWYEMQAFRALNQALGRAVRHRFDYGAILLVDARFRQQRVIDQLPGWTRDGLQASDGRHETLLKGLERFYGSVQEQIASIASVRQEKPATSARQA